MSDESTTPSEQLASPVGPLPTWPIPPEAAGILRDVDLACASVLQKLGQLEVDYLTSRNQLLEELRGRRAQFKTLLDDTARKGGLDIETTRWNLDSRTMTLIRAS